MSFPQNENTEPLVSVFGTSQNALLRFQRCSPRSYKRQHSSSVSHTFRWLTFQVRIATDGSLRIDQNPRLVYENVIEVRRGGAVDSFVLCQHRGKHKLCHTGRHIQSKPQPREAVPLTTKDHTQVGPQGLVESYLQVRSAKVNNRHVSSQPPPLSYLVSTNIRVRCERVHVRVQLTEIHHRPYLVFILLNDRGINPFAGPNFSSS